VLPPPPETDPWRTEGRATLRSKDRSGSARPRSRVGLRPDAVTGELFLAEHGPSLRALYDLSNPQRSRFMHSSGQSGLVFSGHYRSFVEPWARVEYLPVWGDGRKGSVLRLVPR